MITLYEIHWSHFCEKVRLALFYKGLPWQSVSVDAFDRQQIEALGLTQSHVFPTIVDDANINPKTEKARVVTESSPILRYLDETYPDTPRLFPGDSDNQRQVYYQLIEFDTQLAIPARRLGYTQVVLECPEKLSSQLIQHRARIYGLPIVRHILGHMLGMVLTKRFDFHRSESMGLYEALEAYLLTLARRLEKQEFVVGTEFSAADLALAAQIRPLKIIPFFAENPELADLFKRHEDIVRRYGSERWFSYELAIAEARCSAPPVRRRLRESSGELPFTTTSWQTVAANDQKKVWTLSLAAYPFYYWLGLRRNKVRQHHSSPTIR